MQILELSSSFEEYRPQISYFDERNKSRDGGRLLEVLEGDRDLADYVPFELYVETPDALNWDFYSHPGTLGLLSERAMYLLRPFAMRHFQFLEGSLDGAPYYIPMRRRPLECFNREKSEFVTFRHDPSRIMRITKYAFDCESLDDPLMFCIPEDLGGIFVTESIPRMVEEAGLAAC